MKADDPKTIYLKDYQPADFLIDEVFLHFDLYEDKTQVTTVLHMRRTPQSLNNKAALVLNGEAMALQSVAIDGKVLPDSEYTVNETTLTVHEVPEQFTLETVVLIKPHENKQLSGLYTSGGNFCTQCEPHGFRRITYFLDRPDVMSRFTTTITADQSKYPYLLSNGNLVESKSLKDGRHWLRWQDPSLKSCYLFGLVAGDFDLLSDTFTTMSGRQVDLKLYLEKGFSDQGAFALASLKRAMRWDETTWGREYDLDIYMIVAVSDFNMGAMENKGLNIFNTKYVLAKQETATDQDYFNIEAVIGHEYFHNWSGNRVTCRDWFQITLKEGLTVFRDQSFSIDMTSPAVARIPEVNIMRSNQFSEDLGPMSHPIRPDRYIEVNNFYTLTVYRKGAEVIRMVQTLITPALFRQGLDLYFERHDGQAVTTEDFINAMEDASGKDLTQFKQWYSQKGTPELEVDGQYDAAAQTYVLTVKQAQPPLHLPMLMGLVGPECHDMPTQLAGQSDVLEGTRMLELTKSQETFTFINVKEKPTPSLLRNFSAPVRCQYPYTNPELAWLLQCDSDAFSRWNASQLLLTHILLALADTHRQNQTMKMSDLLLETYQALLDSPQGDFNLLSKLLTLPSENYLLSKMNMPHVEAIHAAHQFVKRQLGVILSDHFMTVYQQCIDDDAYQYNVESMARRSLKNVCLSYLTATEQQPFIDLAVKQFDASDNMTDTIGALQALNHYEGPERLDRLNAFYECWKSEPLVVNKWLNLHATSSLPDTFESVKLLLNHPAFDMNNPNNVYALLCGFCVNQIRFHDVSGETYQFIADQVLSLDPKNPQVAARLLQSLITWQQLDAQRGEQMRVQIERISKTDGISSDIYEISTKSK
jgi:aminopeptidase N